MVRNYFDRRLRRFQFATICSLVGLTVLRVGVSRSAFLGIRENGRQAERKSLMHLIGRGATRARHDSRSALVHWESRTALQSSTLPHLLRARTQQRARAEGESEVEQLRRENAELRELAELRRENAELKGKAGEGDNMLEKLTRGVIGAFTNHVVGAIGNMVKNGQEDMESVMSAAKSVLTRSGRLGSRVECEMVTSGSSSSENTNGVQHTSMQLQFQARGDKGRGTVSCSAVIGPAGVDFTDFQLDGSPVDTSRSAASNVIDVG